MLRSRVSPFQSMSIDELNVMRIRRLRVIAIVHVPPLTATIRLAKKSQSERASVEWSR